MMTAYHNKLFLNISHVVFLFFIYIYFFATMTHPYKWAITELRVEKGIHENLSFRKVHIGS